MASSTAEQAPPKSARALLELPVEIQREIVSHCSQSDLICLSLVSKHFRDLAAAQLYRNFHIVFPDEDDPAFDSPIDGLAGGLDTFVTSEYDYAQHLRDISLDTLSAGDKAESAYKAYLYHVSCGKFMNTLLLVTLRKAKALETFRWNIRVELSRQVYQALHRIETLSNVHIRMQAGPSLYETPPPLPYNASHSAPSVYQMVPQQHMTPVNPPGGPPPPSTFLAPPPNSLFYVPATSVPPPPLPKPVVRTKAPKIKPLAKEPSTLSGFKDLKSLAVLDIDTLDVITEIKACVRNSSRTLTKLKLSFSDALANKAREPPPELDPEDSDADDEFQVVPVPAGGASYNDDVSGPARAFRAQEEKKSQDSVLGRILDVEPYVVEKTSKKPREKEKETKEVATSAASPGVEFIRAIQTFTSRMIAHGENWTDQQELLDKLEVIEAAARKVVADNSKFAEGSSQDQKGGQSSDAASSQPTPEAETPVGEASSAPNDTPVSLFSSSAPKKSKDAQKETDPDDIDIESPEEQLGEELADKGASEAPTPTPETQTSSVDALKSEVETSAAEPSTLPGVDKATTALDAQKEIQELRSSDGPLDTDRIAAAEKQMTSINRDVQEVRKEVDVVGAEISDAVKLLPAAENVDPSEGKSQHISEYIRTTRGLGLESLSIYLIPVRPSVLSRAIDFRVLTRITLLNVGNQASIWAHLQKENKESPLPLRKIFTDNVSQPFLTFVSQLEELHEFFILERDAKYKPVSFGPKTTMTIDHIRRFVLKKHVSTLKRLMIKNMADTTWDADEKSVMLICKRGKQLQELACSMGIRVIHTFMQQLSGLINLRALHLIQLRNDDTCVWVMRETKRFLIDNLSHHPHLKLEWISIDDDDRVDRLIRPGDLPKKNKSAPSSKSKGKEKAPSPAGFSLGGEMFPILPALDSWDQSDSEDDEELQDQGIETLENIHFYDVWGVRIFKKEVVTGRL